MGVKKVRRSTKLSLIAVAATLAAVIAAMAMRKPDPDQLNAIRQAGL